MRGICFYRVPRTFLKRVDDKHTGDKHTGGDKHTKHTGDKHTGGDKHTDKNTGGVGAGKMEEEEEEEEKGKEILDEKVEKLETSMRTEEAAERVDGPQSGRLAR